MTNIEARALALVNAVQKDRWPEIDRDFHMHEVENSTPFIALCRAIEARDAFRHKVSERMLNLMSAYGVSREDVADFIIAKPDPLVEAIKALQDGRAGQDAQSYAACLKNELASRGLEIREINNG